MRAPGISLLDRRTSASVVARLSANDTYIASRLPSARVDDFGCACGGNQLDWVGSDDASVGIFHPRTILVCGALIGSLIGV